MYLSVEMTKTGKPDSYRQGVITLYAQRKHTFSKGQRPGGKRWRVVIGFTACPLTRVFGQIPRKQRHFWEKDPLQVRIS